MSTNSSNQPDAQFLARFAEAWNKHDIDALMSFMADDCVFQAASVSPVRLPFAS